MSLESWLVLVVEDEEDSAQVVSQVLRHYGADVRLAHDGEHCLEALSHISPTVVVMDLAMPGLDGWQTLAAMRENPATQHIPVVAITAFGSSRVKKEARQAGFNGYFAKPIEVDSFIEKLQAIVGGG